MDEIKCLIVSDGVKNVSIFDTLHVLLCQVRSRRWTAAAWKQPVSASSPLPASCVPLFPPESQLRTCCPETPPASGNIQPRGGGPVRQTQITSNSNNPQCKKNAHFQLLLETSRSWKGEMMQQTVSLWGRRCAIYPVLPCCGITSVYHSHSEY